MGGTGERSFPAFVIIVADPIGRTDLPAICERARRALEACDTGHVVCDVRTIRNPDAVTVDALARLLLTARRLGLDLRLRNACGELIELLDLMGLREVVPLAPELDREPGRKAEEREPAIGIEEEADPADPVT